MARRPGTSSGEEQCWRGLRYEDGGACPNHPPRSLTDTPSHPPPRAIREAFGRLAKLQAAERRAARVRAAVPPVPPNAATCPRLRAAFGAAAAYGGAKALGDRAERERGASEGLSSRQFQRLCTAAALPVERAAVDVVHTLARRGGRLLTFPRFLEALALVGGAGAGAQSNAW